MMRWLFGNKSDKIDKIQELLQQDALILDVRTKGEWDKGALSGAIHIPLQELSQRLDEIKAYDRPVVAYCEVGGRSAKAANILQKHGIVAVNGGGWRSLKKLL